MNANGELAEFPGHALRAIVSVTKDKKNDQSRSGIRAVDVYEGDHRADYSNKTVPSASSLKEPYYENYNQVMEKRNVSVLDHTPSQNGGQENLHAALCQSDGGLVTFDYSASYNQKELEAELDALMESEEKRERVEKEKALEIQLAKFKAARYKPEYQEVCKATKLADIKFSKARPSGREGYFEKRNNSDFSRGSSSIQNIESHEVPGYIATPRPVRREHLSVSRSTGHAPAHHNHYKFHQRGHPDSHHREKTNGCSRSASLSRTSSVDQKWHRAGAEPLQHTKVKSKQLALTFVQPKPNLAGPESVSVHRPELCGWTDNKGLAEFYWSRAQHEQGENQYQVGKSRCNKSSTVKSQTSSPQGNHVGLKTKGPASSSHPVKPLKPGPENKPEVKVRENRSTETQTPLVAESQQPDQLPLGDGAVSPHRRLLRKGFHESSPSKAKFTLDKPRNGERQEPGFPQNGVLHNSHAVCETRKTVDDQEGQLPPPRPSCHKPLNHGDIFDRKDHPVRSEGEGNGKSEKIWDWKPKSHNKTWTSPVRLQMNSREDDGSNRTIVGRLRVNPFLIQQEVESNPSECNASLAHTQEMVIPCTSDQVGFRDFGREKCKRNTVDLAQEFDEMTGGDVKTEKVSSKVNTKKSFSSGSDVVSEADEENCGSNSYQQAIPSDKSYTPVPSEYSGEVFPELCTELCEKESKVENPAFKKESRVKINGVVVENLDRSISRNNEVRKTQNVKELLTGYRSFIKFLEKTELLKTMLLKGAKFSDFRQRLFYGTAIEVLGPCTLASGIFREVLDVLMDREHSVADMDYMNSQDRMMGWIHEGLYQNFSTVVGKGGNEREVLSVKSATKVVTKRARQVLIQRVVVDSKKEFFDSYFYDCKLYEKSKAFGFSDTEIEGIKCDLRNKADVLLDTKFKEIIGLGSDVYKMRSRDEMLKKIQHSYIRSFGSVLSMPECRKNTFEQFLLENRAMLLFALKYGAILLGGVGIATATVLGVPELIDCGLSALENEIQDAVTSQHEEMQEAATQAAEKHASSGFKEGLTTVTKPISGLINFAAPEPVSEWMDEKMEQGVSSAADWAGQRTVDVADDMVTAGVVAGTATVATAGVVGGAVALAAAGPALVSAAPGMSLTAAKGIGKVLTSSTVRKNVKKGMGAAGKQSKSLVKKVKADFREAQNKDRENRTVANHVENKGRSNVASTSSENVQAIINYVREDNKSYVWNTSGFSTDDEAGICQSYVEYSAYIELQLIRVYEQAHKESINAFKLIVSELSASFRDMLIERAVKDFDRVALVEG